jgi:hypothetical protein
MRKCFYMEVSEGTTSVYVCRLPDDGHLAHHMTYGWSPLD